MYVKNLVHTETKVLPELFMRYQMQLLSDAIITQ